MKVVIATDMEGVSGINRVQQCLKEFPNEFTLGRANLTADINACIRGLLEAGASEIKVVEQHGGFRTGWGHYRAIDFNDLEGKPQVLYGPASRIEPLITWADAVVLLGYHAMAGTLDGFLSHTVRPSAALWFNGEPVGEIAMTAAGFGARGVPVVLVTGDAAAVREAGYFLPWAIKVEVKKAATRKTLESALDRDEASLKIERGAAKALTRLRECKPLQIAKPVETEVHFSTTEMADAASVLPLTHRRGERALGFTAQTVDEALKFFSSAWLLAVPIVERQLYRSLEALPDAKTIEVDATNAWLREWLEEASPFVPNERAVRGGAEIGERRP